MWSTSYGQLRIGHILPHFWGISYGRLELRERKGKPRMPISNAATGNFDSLHIARETVFLFHVADISATEVGEYVRRNEEPSGHRSAPSLEFSLLPGLRGHQQQPRRRMPGMQK